MYSQNIPFSHEERLSFQSYVDDFTEWTAQPPIDRAFSATITWEDGRHIGTFRVDYRDIVANIFTEDRITICLNTGFRIELIRREADEILPPVFAATEKGITLEY